MRLMSMASTSADDRERVPRRTHGCVNRAGEALDRPDRDEDARQREECRLGKRGEMLRFAVAELMRDIGRASRDAHGEVREQRRDEVGARMHRLGHEPETVRGQPDTELEHDEERRGHDRDEG